MTDKRFKRYLLDGGFSFGEEYVPPKWSISDGNTKGSPFGFLEFDDEHKDLCDEIVDSLNEFVDEYNHLKEENTQFDILIKNNQLAYIDLEKENEQLKARLYAEKTNTAEVINDYAKQFKRHSAQFSFMMDLAEDLGIDISKLEALDD